MFHPKKESTGNYLPEKKPTYYFTVAGAFGERQTRIRKSSFKDSGDRHDLFLIPEPDNPADKNAVIIYARKVGQIGYVPANIAKEINQFMLEYPNYALSYEKVDARPWDPDDEDIDVEVKLYALDSSEALIAAEQKAEKNTSLQILKRHISALLRTSTLSFRFQVRKIKPIY